MNEDRHIISEFCSFFAESNNTKAIQVIMNIMSHNTLTYSVYGLYQGDELQVHGWACP